MLNQKEKFVLIVLIILSLIMITISIYARNESMSNMKRILNNKIHIIKTGGNIEQTFTTNYNKNRNKLGLYDIVEYDTNSSPKLWNDIVNDITNNYNHYDAFIIISDLDTMPYTASALSFMLENLNKPVIITSDNLLATIKLTSITAIPEVMIYNNKNLLRACRSIQSNSSNKIISPNYPPLNSKNSLNYTQDKLRPKLLNPNTKIIVEKIIPSNNQLFITPFIQNKKIDSLILELEGRGTEPLPNKIINIINNLTKKGIIVVAVSNCNKKLLLSPDLIKAGVISSNMTLPATYTKLLFLLTNVSNKKLIPQLLLKCLRGEL